MTKKITFLAGMFIACITFANETKYDLLLSSGTVITEPNLESALKLVPSQQEYVSGKYYRYIQFNEIPSTETKMQMAAAGIKPMLYLPQNTFMVSIKQGTDLSILKNLDVRGLYTILPGYKMLLELHDAIKNNAFPGFAMNANGTVGITFTYYEDISHAAVMSALEHLNIEVTYQNFFSQRITAWVPKNDLIDFLSLPFVCAAELKDDKPVPDNNVGRTLHRDNAIATDYAGGRKYNGANVNVMLQDDGIIGPHIDYTGRLIQQYISFNNGDHGDHCAGIIMAGGNKDPLTRGMGWGANIYVYEASPNYQGFDSIPIHYTSNGIVISSTSYSDGCNTGYTSFAQQLDQQIYTMPNLIHVFSAGNMGTSDCGYGAGAGWGNVTGGHKHSKNSIAVGNLDYIDGLNSSSSRGPVHDGRMKPEICAQGTNVYSTSDPNNYVFKTGTSMSCPAISGTFSELYHAYKMLNGNVNPPSALIKAIIMNTADDLGNAGPDFRHGYGRVNGLNAVKTIESVQYLNGSVSQGNTNNHSVVVPANVLRMKVLVCWHDYQAAVNASVALVNNLNMVVTAPNTTTYNPWILDYTPNAAALNSVAVRGIDIRNNHEQMTLDNPAAGTYNVAITGATVPQGPQTYYLTYFFETAGPELTYPIGGEGFVPGETEVIRWDAFGNTGTFNIEYSINNGGSWISLATNYSASLRYFSWTVPTQLSGQCLVRVTRGVASDMSDANFSIIGLPSNITMPWACPSSLRLSWNTVPGATSYDVFKLGPMYMDSIGTTTADSFIVTGISSANTYWFSVRARGPLNAVGRRAIAVEKVPGVFNCVITVDAAVTTINSPTGTLPTCLNLGNLVVNIGLDNPGLASISNIPVHYRVDNGTPVNETYTGTLAPSASGTYSFTTTANISVPGTHAIKAWVTYPSDGNINNDTAIVTVVVANGTLQPFPWTENFETFTNCGAASDCGTTICALANGFINESSTLIDAHDWRTDDNDTPSANTGPAVDFNPGTATGNYLYTEASACFNSLASLLSPCIDLTTANTPWLTFGYHMYGADMGTLSVDVFAGNTWNNNAFTITGNQGNAWNNASVNLSAYVGQIITIRWRGTTGANFASDMAIDAINVSNSSTGIQGNNELSNVLLFPNPGTGEFNLLVNGMNNEKLVIEVVDVTGRVVYSNYLGIQNGSISQIIDFSKQASGVYQLVIRRGDKVQNVKMSKM